MGPEPMDTKTAMRWGKTNSTGVSPFTIVCMPDTDVVIGVASTNVAEPLLPTLVPNKRAWHQHRVALSRDTAFGIYWIVTHVDGVRLYKPRPGLRLLGSEVLVIADASEAAQELREEGKVKLHKRQMPHKMAAVLDVNPNATDRAIRKLHYKNEALLLATAAKRLLIARGGEKAKVDAVLDEIAQLPDGQLAEFVKGYDYLAWIVDRPPRIWRDLLREIKICAYAR